MLNEKIIDLQTGDETIRPYTENEIAAAAAEVAKAQAKAELFAQKVAAKQELLAKLGITADEAKLLLL